MAQKQKEREERKMSSMVKVVDVWWNKRLVGRIALEPSGLCAFEYDQRFLVDGVSVSPFELPLKSGTFIARRTPFDGGFGVFDDCLPDGWGLLLLDRYLRKRNVNPNSLTLLDRLSLVGSTGRGALEFVPDKSEMPDNTKADFSAISTEIEQILSSENYGGTGIDSLYARGGSPGGARPKIFVKDGDGEWLVKFPARYDRQDIGMLEYECSLLARKCGIEMPETKLFEGKYFGTKRFDRTSSGKLHVISMAGLVCADYRSPSIDYLHIFQACKMLTHSINEMWKIYRLMVFNYLIGNKDDHAKNFAFIYRDGDWHFAPAYDILPSEGFNGYHTTTFNDRTEPTDNGLIDLAVNVGLNRKQASEILGLIRDEVKMSGIELF